MGVVLVGLSHRTAPVEVREKLAFSEARVPHALEHLRVQGIAEEAVILSTCNRVEIYVSTNLESTQAIARIREFMVGFHGVAEPPKDTLYSRPEPESVEHLFRVACGLDSMVLGETEILGQLKKAYDLALKAQATGKRLNKAFQRAFNVAKQIRTETNIQRGATSVAGVAVELSERIFSTLKGRTVLVMGAGDTSEKTARALVSRGATTLLITNRSYDKAAAIATELGGQALPFESWMDSFPKLDIIVSSTSAPGYVLERSKLAPLFKSRRGNPLLLIDIAVPRDIDPELNNEEGVYLYNVDDLQTIAQDALRQRQEEIVRCENIIKEKARSLTSGGPPQMGEGSRLAYGS